MSFPPTAPLRYGYAAQTPNLKDEKLESLHTHYEFLNLLRLRHLQWTSTADDSQVEGAHLEIAELIEQITDRYNELFEKIEAPVDGG